jgi:HAMP domain-containing protein
MQGAVQAGVAIVQAHHALAAGNPSVRLGACNAITRVWAKHVEEVAVQDQISALEGQVAELLEQLDEQRRQGWRP